MALDRKKVTKQTEEAAQRSGRFRYLKKNTTTSLRIFEYPDAEGSIVFAQALTEHRRANQAGKGLGICRTEMFGKPCALCKINQMADDAGKGKPFISKTRYIINALDVNNEPNIVRLWIVPTSVFDQLADFGLSDEWQDIFEPKTGTFVNIKREGEGLETNYSSVPSRKPYPVGKEILAQIVDPMTEVRDPGLENQCALIGINIQDVFQEDELEELKRDESSAQKVQKAPAKYSVPLGTKKTAFTIGQTITVGEDPAVYHIVSLNGNIAIVEDSVGDQYEAAIEDLVAFTPTKPKKNITAPKPPAIDSPACFGDPNLYSVGDNECQNCGFYNSCGATAELNKAGVGKHLNKHIQQFEEPQKAKTIKKTTTETDQFLDDIVGNVVRGNNKKRK